MRLPSLTIVLPAFNEERIIAKTIYTSKRAAERVTSDFEILVVNDGSRDRTGEIIRKLSPSEPWLRGVFHPRQMGYGRALSSGFYNARKEFVFYTDSDAPVNVSRELPKAASIVSEGVDAVIGFRKNRSDILLRRVYSLIYNFLTRILLGIKVHDVNFSCKLFRRCVFEKFRLHSHSVFIDAEILANLNLNGFKIKEFPATYVPRRYGQSNFDSPLYAFKVFMEMITFWLTNYHRQRKSKR